VGDALPNYEWELMVSRDGVHFSRVSDGRPFLGRGRAGQWDQGGIQAALPVRVGDESWFPMSRTMPRTVGCSVLAILAACPLSTHAETPA
jgi:hypothetical protein